MYRTLFYTSITLDTNTGNLRRMILPDSPHRTNFCTTSAIDARIGRNRFCFQEIHHLFIPSFGFIIPTVIRSPLSRNLYSGKTNKSCLLILNNLHISSNSQICLSLLFVPINSGTIFPSTGAHLDFSQKQEVGQKR